MKNNGKNRNEEDFSHLDNAFMNTPVASVNESTGSCDNMRNTHFTESPRLIADGKKKHRKNR